MKVPHTHTHFYLKFGEKKYIILFEKGPLSNKGKHCLNLVKLTSLWCCDEDDFVLFMLYVFVFCDVSFWNEVNVNG